MNFSFLAGLAVWRTGKKIDYYCIGVVCHVWFVEIAAQRIVDMTLS